MNIDYVASALALATRPEDVFGQLPGKNPQAQTKALKKIFHQLARTAHSDLVADRRADLVMKDLLAWRVQALDRIRSGKYGTRACPARPRSGSVPSGSAVIRTRARTYVIAEALASGDLADLYLAKSSSNDTDQAVVLKIARQPNDQDLLTREARVLKRLGQTANHNDRHFRRYLPTLHEASAVTINDQSRALNVLRPYNDTRRYFSLAQVIAAFPQGLDLRSAAWMISRLLEVLAWTHRQGLLHGAVLPEHVLINEAHHGAKLIDWCYSVEDWPSGKRVDAISVTYRSWYPPEVLAKSPANPATDIYLAAGCAAALLGGDGATGQLPNSVPSRVARILAACRIPNPHRRYQNTFELYADFRQALEQQYGPPCFTSFQMPVRRAGGQDGL